MSFSQTVIMIFLAIMILTFSLVIMMVIVEFFSFIIYEILLKNMNVKRRIY